MWGRGVTLRKENLSSRTGDCVVYLLAWGCVQGFGNKKKGYGLAASGGYLAAFLSFFPFCSPNTPRFFFDGLVAFVHLTLLILLNSLVSSPVAATACVVVSPRCNQVKFLYCPFFISYRRFPFHDKTPLIMSKLDCSFSLLVVQANLGAEYLAHLLYQRHTIQQHGETKSRARYKSAKSQ